MIEKNTQEAKIRSGPPKRSPVCHQTTRDIVIPAGTILRSCGDDEYSCNIGCGVEVSGAFSVTIKPGAVLDPVLKRVVAA